MISKKFASLTPAKLIILSFFALILTGACLLMLPAATKSGESTSFLDALFTATSATCVTGLIIYDTYSYWSVFGQAIILLLIQIGGMGVVTAAIAISLFTGQRISLRQRSVLQESISGMQVGGIVRLASFILKAILLFEGTGALLLAFRFCPEFGLFKGLWYAVFHAVSAFCNAGFDLMGTREAFSSLTDYAGDPLVNLVIMLLIVLGGLGFLVWDDVREHRLAFVRYRLQTKVVLTTTALLIVVPAIYFFFVEFSRPVWAQMTGGERFWASLFQSVTPRTAGFNSVDLTLLTEPGVLLMIALMLIGGSPGSTAGGVKTTTFATLLLCVRSVLKKQESIQCFGRRIESDTLKSAVSLLVLYATLFLTGGAIIALADGVPLIAALFETASAIGTVGLSLGITGELGTVSHITLIALMYFGRVGGLTMLYAVAERYTAIPTQLPLGRLTVG
ncbi:MAG: TrkH family potassium uptake protein [Oscillospiraceae bacterium]